MWVPASGENEGCVPFVLVSVSTGDTPPELPQGGMDNGGTPPQEIPEVNGNTESNT